MKRLDLAEIARADLASIRRYSIFFEADESRVLVVRVLHDRMDYRRHLDSPDIPGEDA